MEDSEVSILFIVCGIIWCCFLTQILLKFHINYTQSVVIYCFGMAITLLASSSTGNSIFDQSLALWLNMDGNLILYVFLPILIFGEVKDLKYADVKAGLASSCLLAFLGLLLQAAILILFVKAMTMPYDWSWILCGAFVAIMSGTDPVSIVSLLKHLSANPKLTMIIILESLMNDGSGVILSSLFLMLLNGHSFSFASVVLTSFNSICGSLLYGAVIGTLTCYWLKLAYNKELTTDTEFFMVLVSFTISCAFATFFISQYCLNASGILACFASGIVFSFQTQYHDLYLSDAVYCQVVFHIWEFLKWLCTTVLFLLSGLIAGKRLLRSMPVQDWFMLLALYVILMLARLLMISACYPLLKDSSSLSFAEAKFLAFCGLRGPLAIALLVIFETQAFEGNNELSEELPRFSFFICGLTTMTLVINGVIAPYALQYLGLLSDGSHAIERMEVEIISETKFVSSVANPILNN